MEQAPLPAAAYFDPAFIGQRGSNIFEETVLQMNAMQLQAMNTFGRQLQSGVIFQEYPFAPPPRDDDDADL